MLDHFFGLLLLGLGLQSPITQPMVKGDDTEHSSGATGSGNSGGGGSGATGASSASGSTGSSHQAEAEPTETPKPTKTPDHSGTRKPTDKIRPTGETNDSRKGKNPDSSSRKPDPRKAMRDALKLELKEGKDVYHTKFAQHAEEFEQEIEKNHATALAEFTEKRAEMEKKLALFKDQKKKEKITDLQTRAVSLNTKLVENAKTRLTKIASILDDVIAKKGQTDTTGKDTAAFDAAVTGAQGKILAAQDALAAQSTKTYVVTVTTETNAKNDVGTLLKQLNADRSALNETIVAARKGVSLAIQELAKLRGETVPDSVIK